MYETLLTPAQTDALRAALDRIIPPGDNDPGAVEAGVLDTLLAQLTGDLSPQLWAYQSALDALNAAAQSTHNGAAGFADLRAGEQDALLAAVEKTPFFRALVEHAQEIFYTSPAGLQMVGFEVTA